MRNRKVVFAEGENRKVKIERCPSGHLGRKFQAIERSQKNRKVVFAEGEKSKGGNLKVPKYEYKALVPFLNKNIRIQQPYQTIT